MKIRVIYRGWEQDAVTPQVLERLILSGEVRKFKRGSGWVDVKSERIRKQEQAIYGGQERRFRH